MSETTTPTPQPSDSPSTSPTSGSEIPLPPPSPGSEPSSPTVEPSPVEVIVTNPEAFDFSEPATVEETGTSCAGTQSDPCVMVVEPIQAEILWTALGLTLLLLAAIVAAQLRRP